MDGHLDIDEFLEGMLVIFSGQYEKLINLAFNIYDFDGNGQISRNDVKIVFSHIPLMTKMKANTLKFKYEKEEYIYRVESQEEINTYLNKIFNNNQYISLDTFQKAVEEASSEAFLFVILFT